MHNIYIIYAVSTYNAHFVQVEVPGLQGSARHAGGHETDPEQDGSSWIICKGNLAGDKVKNFFCSACIETCFMRLRHFKVFYGLLSNVRPISNRK